MTAHFRTRAGNEKHYLNLAWVTGGSFPADCMPAHRVFLRACQRRALTLAAAAFCLDLERKGGEGWKWVKKGENFSLRMEGRPPCPAVEFDESLGHAVSSV
eukprot:365800-Chlamydomonas_euryale.AAC.3